MNSERKEITFPRLVFGKLLKWLEAWGLHKRYFPDEDFMKGRKNFLGKWTTTAIPVPPPGVSPTPVVVKRPTKNPIIWGLLHEVKPVKDPLLDPNTNLLALLGVGILSLAMAGIAAGLGEFLTLS